MSKKDAFFCDLQTVDVSISRNGETRIFTLQELPSSSIGDKSLATVEGQVAKSLIKIDGEDVSFTGKDVKQWGTGLVLKLASASNKLNGLDSIDSVEATAKN